jgi:hypothetical protein
MIAAVITMRLIISYSKREAKKAKELEENLESERQFWDS